ncbi:MAG: hydantoinase/oxoprolinase family protein [Candidatus Thorarchaeota archaeon]|jgi:N-methylhydantoinase A
MRVIGVDVGGTFTDIIMIETISGSQVVHKVPSTPESQDIAVIEGIGELLERESVSQDDVSLIVHGTTVATNAMLERKGSRVCLVTTAGLEDVLEIGRQNREEIYSLQATRPKPLVVREDRIGVMERVDSNGGIIQPLDQREIDRVIQLLKSMNPEAIAISLLFSFKNPNHERLLLKKIRKKLECYAVASYDVLPEFREFERTSTTVLEAYLGPLVTGYLKRLNESVQKICKNGKLAVMQSNGGTMLGSRIEGNAVGLAISGLAGGVIGGWNVSKGRGLTNAITLDMGGTSCDISAIVHEVRVRPDNEVAGLPLRTPSVDVKTIGAGGGSIAWVDDANILRVGPQSAGAIPGPAAYAKGGVVATVTDATLLAGRLNPDYFLGGRIKLDLQLAKKAISKVASQIERTTEESALGIIRISTANMVQATREVTVEQGLDPREFVLVPFGGAGPTQATDIAEALHIENILVPPYPGITSALGLVSADLRVDLMRTVLLPIGDKESKIIKSEFRNLTKEAMKRLEEQGVPRDRISFELKIDMRYIGQSHELSITVPHDTDNLVEQSKGLFEDLHERTFGYRMSDREVEWVTVRVVAKAPQSEIKPLVVQDSIAEVDVESRMVLLNKGTWVSADVYQREKIPLEIVIKGPAVIEQVDTTSYIAPGWIAKQETDGSIWIRRQR